MTVVVADTSPLNYLILIEAIDLLPQRIEESLFGRGEQTSHRPIYQRAVWACGNPYSKKRQAPGASRA
jgi:hypothetical protein